MVRHEKGQGRKPITPNDFEGKKAVDDWKNWADDNGMSIMSVHKMGDMIRLFFLFACNSNDLCEDFCRPYILEGRVEACEVCNLKKNPKLLRETGSKKQPKDLTWEDVVAYKTFLTKTPAKPRRSNMDNSDIKFRAKSTINSCLGAVQSWFKFMADSTKTTKWQHRYAMAKSVSKQPHVYKKPHRSIDLKVLMRIIDEAKKECYENYAVLMMLLYTGGRAQFYGLQKKDITWGEKNGETSEGRDIKKMGRISIITKGGKPEEVPLHPKLQKILKRHIKNRGYPSEMLFKYGRVPKNNEDYKANEQVPYRMIKRIAEKLDIEESIYTHRIRKTVGKYGPKLGIDPKFMQKILTHKDFSTTENIYREVDFDDVAEAWSKVDFEKAAAGNPKSQMDIEGIFKQLDEIVDQVPKQFQEGMKGMVDGMKSFIKGALGGAS